MNEPGEKTLQQVVVENVTEIDACDRDSDADGNIKIFT